MKKLGKKVSFLTKIMLVIGLLISNLSSLSIVFAYEAPNLIDIKLVDNELVINYLGELAEEVETVNVVVYENYTYLDGTDYCEDYTCEVLGRTTPYTLTSEEFLNDGLLIENTILSGMDDSVLENIEVFDGLYEVRVEVIDALENEIGTNIYSTDVEHKKGLDIKVYDATLEEDVLVELVNNKYLVSENAKVVAKLLSGGLSPTDKFSYEDGEIFALDLLNEEFEFEYNFEGLLYGEYEIPVVVELEKAVDLDESVVQEVALASSEEEKLVYTENLNLSYGTLLVNGEKLSESASLEGYGSSYLFNSKTSNGSLAVLLDLGNEPVKRTMLDLYKIAERLYKDNEKVTYVLSNSQYEDVVSSYENLINEEQNPENDVEVVVESEEEQVTLDEYLSEILLDDTAVLTVFGDGVNEDVNGITVTYSTAIVGDLVHDNVLDEKDVLALIEQVVSGKVEDEVKSDVTGNNGTVNTRDIMHLSEVIKNSNWDVSLSELEDVELNARLDLEDKEVYSGDTFDVEYVLSLSDYDVNGVTGLFEYDKSLFELVSVSVDEDWLGNNKDGKFVYITDQKLLAPEVLEDEEETQTEEELVAVSEESEEEVSTNEYVVVTATFKALKALSEEDNAQISLTDIELFDEKTYMLLNNNEITTDLIVVNASDNNKLSSLTVAGQEITLEENVYEYVLTVSNEVTTLDVVYELENVAANVTSIVSPEELVEGENIVSITVVAESGLEQVYTIKVTREAAPKEETVTNTNNYYGDYDNNEDDEIILSTPEKEEEEVVEKKSGTLSRVIIIILILLVIAGLIYLIFKDEDDEEVKKANKEINKLKKEVKEPVDKEKVKKTDNGSKNKGSKNNKKER